MLIFHKYHPFAMSWSPYREDNGLDNMASPRPSSSSSQRPPSYTFFEKPRQPATDLEAVALLNGDLDDITPFLHDNNNDHDGRDRDVENSRERCGFFMMGWATVAWLLALFMTSMCTWLMTSMHYEHVLGTFNGGYVTELCKIVSLLRFLRRAEADRVCSYTASVANVLDLQIKMFTGKLQLSGNEEEDLIKSPYTGYGEQVDIAWEELIHGEQDLK